MTSFRERYGPWALVAGASEGLGFAFADDCARAARRRLGRPSGAGARSARERADPTPRRSDTRPTPRPRGAWLGGACARDRRGAADRARDPRRGLCATRRASRPPLDELLRAIDVNVRAPLTLARELGAPMRERGRGGLIVVSSVAGLRGTETLATYAATKAFGRVLAEGLYAELRPRGVDVLACLAGATRTPGYEATTRRDVAPVMEPRDVARATLDALGRGPVFVPGRSNRAAVWALERVLPRRVAIALLGRSTRALNG
ncbi:MAG: SDR family NAD(P)-dependent oxidoreductase [Sandaracinus sp.]|nr:SDR family NAD(P)-dependent oxidoreductase [Sandaracinus sp.]